MLLGAAAESARNYYYPNNGSKHPDTITMEYLCSIPNLSFLRIPELHLDFNKWLNSMSEVQNKLNYNTLDFLFWEHREGSWQAQISWNRIITLKSLYLITTERFWT